MIYVLLSAMIIINTVTLIYVWDIVMDLCHIMTHTERTYDILSKWAIYYVCKEWDKGNTKPIDFIFPDDREDIEEKIKQEKCHIDKYANKI